MPLLNEQNITSILNGCLKNDRKSQRELYRHFYDLAVRICCRYTNDREECVALVNASFFKLFKNIRQVDATDDADTLLSLKEWFKRILINTCIDHYHKINSDSHGYDPNNIGELSCADPIEAIRSLSPTYRMVFNLSVVERLSHEEISQMLGISVNASQACLSKAKGHLETLLVKNHIIS